MFDSLHRIDGQGLHVVEHPPEAGLADTEAYNSPSKAPLADDCRACAVLAALCFQDGSRVAVSIQSKNSMRKALAGAAVGASAAAPTAAWLNAGASTARQHSVSRDAALIALRERELVWQIVYTSPSLTGVRAAVLAGGR
jgi:hypothetical protein